MEKINEHYTLDDLDISLLKLMNKALVHADNDEPIFDDGLDVIDAIKAMRLLKNIVEHYGLFVFDEYGKE